MTVKTISQRRAHERKRHPPCQIVIDENAEGTGVDMFIVFDGVRIAKRGQPDTPQARTWVSLEPGWAVYSDDEMKTITVEHHGVVVQ